MASAETEQAVEVEVRIAASPETVFDFLVEPDKMIQWMGRSAILEPRPGAPFAGLHLGDGDGTLLQLTHSGHRGGRVTAP